MKFKAIIRLDGEIEEVIEASNFKEAKEIAEGLCVDPTFMRILFDVQGYCYVKELRKIR